MSRSVSAPFGLAATRVSIPSTGLDPYRPSEQAPWDARRARHLLRRTGFRVDPQHVIDIVAQDPLDVVDQIVDDVLQSTLPTPPPIASQPPPPVSAPQAERDAYTLLNVEAGKQYRIEWLRLMAEQGLREKMTLLWSNHVVTQLRIYFYTAYAVQYMAILRTRALGDFKQLIYDIGLTPAMVKYLDGSLNKKGHPNENYARELLELFTTGLGQYAQTDVAELARALTGWSDQPEELSVTFTPENFDDGLKTIFGRTEAFNYDTAIDLVFEERAEAIAGFIAGKLYKFFVYAEPDDVVVQSLAQSLVQHNFQLAPVVRTLLKSEHFFDEAFIGARIKSPTELFGSLLSMVVVEGNEEAVYEQGESLTRLWGQTPLDPPNVAGWEEHRSWITSGTLVERWNSSTRFLRAFESAAPALVAASTDPFDPYVLAKEVAEHFLNQTLSAERIQEFGDTMLAGTPVWEWDPMTEAGQARLASFLIHLVELPDFQLT